MVWVHGLPKKKKKTIRNLCCSSSLLPLLAFSVPPGAGSTIRSNNMAMFIRVKRKKTTYFLHCDPTETILEIKQKVQALSDNPVDCQRLILLNSMQTLDDNKTLADQKVENDAVVALCLKISDLRVHRIPTHMREQCIPPVPSPTPTPPQELAEDLGLAPTEKLPPSPIHRMSRELRVPYRPPKDESKAGNEKGDKEGSHVGSKNDSYQKDNPKRQSSKKENAKKDGTKELGKQDSAEKDIKKDVSKKGVDKKSGKEVPKKGGKDASKKGGKKTTKVEPFLETEEEVEPPKDTGVWEDITIDKLTDYATLVDSD